MSSSFITVAIAHDSTCKPGEEWVFHGLAGSKDSSSDGMSGQKDGGSDDKFLTYGCLIVGAFVAIVICFVIWAIWRLA